MKKKRVIIIAAFAVAAALLGTGGFMLFRGNQTEDTVTLAENQRLVYAYLTSIQGNEITYIEVDESLVTAQTQAADTENSEKTEDVDSTEMPQMGEAPSGDAPSGGMPDGDAPSGDTSGNDSTSGDMPSGDMPSGGMPEQDTSGESTSDGTPEGTAPEASSDGESTAPSKDMPDKDASSDADMNFASGSSETVTATIPVGVTVHTAADTETTFSRLASGDLLKMVLETDADGNDVIIEIWMLQ